MNVRSLVAQLGLQEREVRLYLATLELGESTVLPISKKAGIQRTYCYDILESLREKGLVSYLEKNGRRRYLAEPPEKIEHMLRARLEHFRQVLPELRSLYQHGGQRPNVRFYEGKAGVLAISQELTHAKRMDAISSTDHLYAVLGDEIDRITKKIAAHNVETRELYTQGIHPISWLAHYREPRQQIRFLPKGMKLSIDFLLYDNKLALISYEGDIHSLVIEGSSIVDSLRVLFELLWQHGEPLSTKKAENQF